MFFKRFNNMNNDLHILRIPRKWAAYLAMNLAKHKAAASLHNRRVNRKVGFNQLIEVRRHQKLFKYLALTYLNIFKFKVSHPMLNRLKFKLK